MRPALPRPPAAPPRPSPDLQRPRGFRRGLRIGPGRPREQRPSSHDQDQKDEQGRQDQPGQKTREAPRCGAGEAARWGRRRRQEKTEVVPADRRSGEVSDRLPDLDGLGEILARRLMVTQAEGARAALVERPGAGRHVAQPLGRREHALDDLAPRGPTAGDREWPLDRAAETADGLPALRRGRRVHRLPQGSGLFVDAARVALRPGGEPLPELLLPELHLPGLPHRLVELDPQAVPRAVGLHHPAREEPVEDAVGIGAGDLPQGIDPDRSPVRSGENGDHPALFGGELIEAPAVHHRPVRSRLILHDELGEGLGGLPVRRHEVDHRAMIRMEPDVVAPRGHLAAHPALDERLDVGRSDRLSHAIRPRRATSIWNTLPGRARYTAQGASGIGSSGARWHLDCI
jgi:hypothetical protein